MLPFASSGLEEGQVASANTGPDPIARTHAKSGLVAEKRSFFSVSATLSQMHNPNLSYAILTPCEQRAATGRNFFASSRMSRYILSSCGARDGREGGAAEAKPKTKIIVFKPGEGGAAVIILQSVLNDNGSLSFSFCNLLYKLEEILIV